MVSLKVRSVFGVQKIQLTLSIIFGWFCLGQLWNDQVLDILGKTSQSPYPTDDQHMQCDCPSVHCPPCSENIDNPIKRRSKNAEIAGSYYRSLKFTPSSAEDDETHRWRVLTKKHNYEMINQESMVGINGMWSVEVKQVDVMAQSLIRNHNSKDNQASEKLDLKDIYRHSDPYHGVTYIANYAGNGQSGRTTHSSVEMWRPFIGGAPKLVDISHAGGKEMISIISPLSKVTVRFHLFLQRYEDDILSDPLSGPVRILFVLFQDKSDDESSSDAATAVDRFKERNPGALIDYIFTKGDFNRAVGLHAGVMECKDDEILLFLDVDLAIGPGFLGRLRRNTVQHKRVAFPIMFSQYDPDVMDEAAKLDPDLLPLVSDKMAINKETGFWIYYAFGVAAMYKSDYLKVGGFRLDIKGWGGEDVDLFKKMVADKDLDVMTMVDPELIHVYHKRGCDVTLAPDQYAMCVGAWAETLGSQRQVARLYLDNHMKPDTQ